MPKIKIMSEIKYTVIHQDESHKVSKLLRVYKEDPFSARIMYFNDTSGYTSERLVIFEYPNGDFEIVGFEKTFGVSISNRIYTREKKKSSIIYKKNKFYITRDKKISQLTYGGLYNFFLYYFSGKVEMTSKMTSGIEILKQRFKWIRFIEETPSLHGLSFNSVINHKLYNLNDALRYLYKSPIKVAKIVSENLQQHTRGGISKSWKLMLPYLTNSENIRIEMIKHHLFPDTVRMAKTLNKKVNCSWSLKRLELEHNKWSKEITLTILRCEPLENLTVAKIYREFAEFSGFKLLVTNKDMMYEGMIQNHCVATYIQRVNRGDCAIFHIQGYTLELCFGNQDYYSVKPKKLYISQFRGHKNINAPVELFNMVDNKIADFMIERKDSIEQLLETKNEVAHAAECVWL